MQCVAFNKLYLLDLMYSMANYLLGHLLSFCAWQIQRILGVTVT